MLSLLGLIVICKESMKGHTLQVVNTTAFSGRSHVTREDIGTSAVNRAQPSVHRAAWRDRDDTHATKTQHMNNILQTLRAGSKTHLLIPLTAVLVLEARLGTCTAMATV